MSSHLSHSEIERIIDEQERELDFLIRQSQSLDDPESVPQPSRGAGLRTALRKFWQRMRSLFGRDS